MSVTINVVCYKSDRKRLLPLPCPRILVPFLKQIVGNVVPVTERLDALPLRVGLTLVTDEKPFKIFSAVHIIIILMLTARR